MNEISQDNQFAALLLAELEDGTWLKDVTNNQLLYLCENLSNIFEVDLNEIEKNPQLLTAYIHPKDVDHVNSAFTSLYEQPGVKEITYRLQQGRSSPQWVSEKRKSFYYGDQFLMLGIVRDITAYKREEEVRQAMEANHKTVFDNIIQSFILFDKEGYVKAFNEIAYERSKGILRKSLKEGLHATEFLVDNDQAEFSRKFDLALNNQSTEQERCLDYYGKKVWFKVYYLPSYDQNSHINGVLFTAHDISEQKQKEEALQESEQKYRELVERAHDGICIIQDGKIIYANPNLQKMWKGEEKDIIGQPFGIFVHPDERQKVEQLHHQRKGGEEVPELYETRLFTSDGNAVPAEISVGSIQYEGKPAKLVLVRDITKRKQAEETLKETESKYRGLVEQSLTGIYIIQDGVFKYVNPKLAEIFGYEDPSEVLESVKVKDLVHANDRGKVKENLDKRLTGNQPELKYEFKGVKKDGSIIYVEVHGLRSFFEDRPAVIGTLLDVTERTMANKKLKENEQRLDLAIKASDLGLYDTDFANHTSIVNDRYIEMIGEDPSTYEETFEKWKERIHPEDYEHIETVMDEIFEGARTDFEIEYRVRHKNGNYIWIQDSGRAIDFDKNNQPVRLIGTNHEVTQAKEGELEKLRLIDELTRQNDNLKQFSYIVSHNLRKPVANLRGLLEFLNQYVSKESYNENVYNIINMIYRSISELEDVIMDLDQILLLRHGTGEEFEAISLQEAIRKNKQLLAKEIELSNVNIEVNLEAEKVWGVRGYVNSVLYNLISNAIKYSHQERQPEVKIKARQDDGKVKIQVSDNGIGMDLTKHRGKLFQLYSRLNIQKEGKGIGLFLVKTQVESMNGQIEIDSQPGQGTTFTILLPEPGNN